MSSLTTYWVSTPLSLPSCNSLTTRVVQVEHEEEMALIVARPSSVPNPNARYVILEHFITSERLLPHSLLHLCTGKLYLILYPISANQKYDITDPAEASFFYTMFWHNLFCGALV